MEARRGEVADLESKLKALAGKGGGSVETRDARRELFKRVVRSAQREPSRETPHACAS